MWFSIRYLLGFLHGLWRIWLWLWFLTCLLVWAGVWFFSELPQYRSYIEQKLHLILEQPIIIGELSTYWVGGYPTIGIQKIHLLEAHSRTPIAEIGYLEIMLDIKASLRQKQLVTRMIIASGCKLTVVHHPEGHLSLQGLKQASPPASFPASFFIVGLPNEILFQANTLNWLEPHSSPLTLTSVQLHLKKHQDAYQLKGQTTLQRAETFQVKQLNFESEFSFKDPSNFYVQWNLEKFHLALHEGQFTFARLQGQIEVKQQQTLKGWQIEAKNLLAWPSSSRPSVSLPRFKITKKNRDFHGEVEAFSFNTLKPFVQAYSSQRQEWFTAGQGHLQGIQWRYTPHHWSFKTDFSGLSFSNGSSTIQNGSGQLILEPQSGKVNFNHLTVKLELPKFYDHPLLLNKLQGEITWQQRKQTWKVSFKDLNFTDSNQLNFTVTGQITLATQKLLEHHIQIQFNPVSSQQLRNYLPSALLKEIKLSTGQFHTLELLVTGKDLQQSSLKLKGTLEKVNLSVKDFLEVRNFSGSVDTSLAEGSLKIRQADLITRFPKGYTHPLSLSRLQGQLSWKYHENQWYITLKQLQASDRMLHLSINGRIKIPWQNNIPYSDLVIEFREGQLAQISSYVPDRRLPQLSKWFNHAQLTGRLTQAKAILIGPLNQLFKDGASVFKFTAQIEQAHIIYAQGWPAISHLQAEIAIDKRQMTITALQGKILNSHLQKLKVNIPDLVSPHPFIKIIGSLQGNPIDGLNFIAQSPLNRSINIGENLELKGKMTLQLNLKIPLFGHQPGQVQGKILFKETTLREKRLNIPVTELHGTLNFDNHRVVAKKMHGKLWGTLPLDFSILTVRNQHPVRTLVNLKGSIDDTFIQEHFLKSSSYSLFSGQTTWEMNLSIPNDPKQSTDILFESDLSGMNIHLPSPFEKLAQHVVPLRIELHKTSSTQIDLRYGELVQGVFQLNPTGLPKGLLQFGTMLEKIELPEQSGLMIEGALPKFSVSEWQAILQSFKASPSSSVSSLDRILLNTKIDHLEIFGQTFEQVALQAQYHLNAWQGAITGKNIEGQMTYSLAHQHSSSLDQESSLDLVFNHLALTLPHPMLKMTENHASSLNPHQLPILSFQCNTLQLDQFNLGQVSFTTEKTQKGLNILLSSYNDALRVLIQAQWQHFIEHPKTQIQLHLHNENIDHMLRHFGFQNLPIEGAKSQWILDASWSGSPLAFRVENLIGNLNFLMTEGRIMNIEPGVGRILGLFDVWALPRRLNLDFSDVFAKGLGFTQAMGLFSIHEGQVHTNNLMLQGTIARIEVAGNTDLVAHTYHQTVTVFPHISNTLPVAGTFAGGLGVGMISLVVQQLLQEEIEKNIHYKYLITGKWDKPNIVSLPVK